MAKGAFGIFYIDAGKAYFYTSSTGATLQVAIPADTMSYFDILSRDKLYQILQTLVTTNKIEPVPVVMLVAPAATYEMAITSKITDEINTQTQQFLDSIPYEKVLSKSYKMQDGAKVFATNKDLYEAVKHGFEKLKFSISAVISLTVLQKMMPDLGTSLNLEVIAARIDAIKQYSFLGSSEINNIIKPKDQEEQKEKPNPMRFYALVGVFVVLLGVLGIMVFFTMQPSPKPVVQQKPPVAQPNPTATPTTAPVVTTQSTTPVQPTFAPTVVPLVSPTATQ